MRSRTPAAVLLTIAMAVPAGAQCPTNPDGGPTLVTLSTAADGSGTDVDVGKNALAHGMEIAALALPVCLDSCDASTDPDCAITSVRPDPASPALAPPLPILLTGSPVCIVLRFPTPAPAASGSANVQTGAVSLATTIQMVLASGATPSNICPTCVGGTCEGGLNDGDPCQVQGTVTVSSTTYDLSRSCQPFTNTPLGIVGIPVTLTTGTASQATCPSQAAGDACSAAPPAGTCDQTTCTSGANGIVQNCCSGNTARSCFPAAGVTRQGQASAPAPAWPSTTYPKQADETVASASCVLPTGGAIVDATMGLPGPAAIEMAATSVWQQVDLGTTTTTLGGGGTTTTIPGNCNPPCNDDDTCTTDTCTGTTCSYPLTSPGIAGARCLIQRMQGRPLCGTDTVDAKLAKTIAKALRTTDTSLGKADAATGKKRTKALKKARAQLTKIDKKTNKAATKGKIEDACKTTILNETTRIREAFADIS